MTDTTPPVTLSAVGDTAVLDVRRYASATLHLKGGSFALVGGSVILEATNVENPTASDWFNAVAAASNSSTAGTSSPLGGASLAADTAAAAAYRVGAVGYTYVRARMTARTSGSVVARWSRSREAIEPVPNVAAAATTITAIPTNGTAHNVVSVAGTNSTSLTTAATNLDEITISNPTATAAFVKLYNKATAPTVGTDVPVMTVPIAAGEFRAVSFANVGKRFSAGIGLAITGAAPATDATAAVAGVVVNLTRR